MTPITREIARFAVNTHFDDLPAKVQHEGLRAFVNYVGCAAGGASEPVCLKMLETISEFNGKSDCVVIGSKVKLDALNAALLNSLSSAALSFNDTHYQTVIHPTSPVGAALISMAMRRKISGKQLIEAVVLGDELCCRIGNILCTPPAECAVGLSTTGLLGCIGAAIAAGKVMGFNEDQMTTAIGIAANQSAGIREAHASMSSWFTPGNAGRSGLWAAFLAERGYTCPDTMIEGVKGFAVSFAVESANERLHRWSGQNMGTAGAGLQALPMWRGDSSSDRRLSRHHRKKQIQRGRHRARGSHRQPAVHPVVQSPRAKKSARRRW